MTYLTHTRKCAEKVNDIFRAPNHMTENKIHMI
jgi:hypothetical protein